MKIALAQLNYHTGNFNQNTIGIINAIKSAKKQNADLILFSELAVCGYPPRDFLEFEDFIVRCRESLHTIAAHCDNIAAIIGSPSVNPKPEGKRLFNSAYFLFNKKIQSVHHKTLLPTYDVFDENRYFEPNKEFNIIRYKTQRIAVTICEDLWNLDNKLYNDCPMDKLIKQKPDFIVNISASPFSYLHPDQRKIVFGNNARKYKLPLFFVNHVGSQTELIFDGGSLVLNAKGNLYDHLQFFEEDLKVYELDKIQKNNLKVIKSRGEKTQTLQSINFSDLNYELIHNALVLGIKDYFRKLNFNKAILGLSGGIDSAVTLVLAVKALGSENVRVILLPSRFTSAASITDAITMAKNLNVSYDVIDIQSSVDGFNNILSNQFKGMPPDVTEENIQARCRAVILMALSNKFGYILLNTSNKSEIAVGYGTLYGDMCGGLAVLGDVYKTQIYELAAYINKNEQLIPLDIIKKTPTAELRPDQKDTDSLPEYEILDKVLFQYIELRNGPGNMIKSGTDEKLVKKILKLVNTNEYKRHQTPPILRISNKAFGMGRRVPIVAKYLS